jgi:hypothetical protein
MMDKGISGSLELSQRPDNIITIAGTLYGLPKNSWLAFHIHQYADFTNPDNACDSAGPHFNPDGASHTINGLNGYNFNLFVYRFSIPMDALMAERAMPETSEVFIRIQTEPHRY